MKLKFIFIFLTIFSLSKVIIYGQPAGKTDPIEISSEVKPLGNNEYNLIIHAKIKPGWHIYSQFIKPGGPIPTNITFSKNPLIQIVGGVKELGDKESNFDPNFKINLSYFSNQVDYVQKIKLKASVKTSLTATLEYMVCTNENCLPPNSKKIKFDL